MTKILAVLVFILAFATAVYADTATVTWTPSVKNTDGTAVNDLSGWNIYSKTTGAYSKLVTVPSTTTNATTAPVSYVDTVTVPANTNFTKCYVVTEFDTSGNESGYSPEACKSFFGVDTVAPLPPATNTVK